MTRLRDTQRQLRDIADPTARAARVQRRRFLETVTSGPCCGDRVLGATVSKAVAVSVPVPVPVPDAAAAAVRRCRRRRCHTLECACPPPGAIACYGGVTSNSKPPGRPCAANTGGHGPAASGRPTLYSLLLDPRVRVAPSTSTYTWVVASSSSSGRADNAPARSCRRRGRRRRGRDRTACPRSVFCLLFLRNEGEETARPISNGQNVLGLGGVSGAGGRAVRCSIHESGGGFSPKPHANSHASLASDCPSLPGEPPAQPT